MIYLSIQDCEEGVFTFIGGVLSDTEPSPPYQEESEGMAELAKVLQFVRSDEYYPSFPEKASYCICSIAGAQYFTNGNKRLAVMLLIMFLMKNEAEVRVMSMEQFKALLFNYFPNYEWDANSNIAGDSTNFLYQIVHKEHAQFLYNLAIVIGDPPNWGTEKFDELKEKVAAIFDYIYRIQ